ncbi:serine/threonine protein kinase [Actinocorallia herbida]|uniref:Serine/threonine protein kinase n=1 Tax=Actinocorallia herbida TaxID=58109 RepID=A0A3N1CUX9_9ACTN|nr:protein kinase [Actinocorallia herbida]ROO85101.1 serine/threonine protein kinase [Actinocorallia herbida]
MVRPGRVTRTEPGDPRWIGTYEVLGRLGFGAQGAVYLGESRSGDRVAIKVPWTDRTNDETVRQRFARELLAARRVPSAYTAAILDADVDGARPYIVSEYVDGLSLHEIVSRDGPYSGAALHRLASYTALALASIHGAGVVHRDFKPANIIIGPDGPRVVDFGIAQALETGVLTTRSPIGTPAFMAPEQFTGGRVGPSTDVFAWGGTILFAASGWPPFGSSSTSDEVRERVLRAVPDLAALSPGPLRDVVARCLAKDPAARPPMLDVVGALTGGPSAPVPAPVPRAASSRASVPRARESRVPAPPAPPPSRGRRRLLWALASVLTVGLAAAIAVFVLKNPAGGTVPDPIAHWSFAGSGGTVTDLTGNGNTGFLEGGATQSDGALTPSEGSMATKGPVVDTLRGFTVTAVVRLFTREFGIATIASQDGAVNGGFQLAASRDLNGTKVDTWRMTVVETDQKGSDRVTALERRPFVLGAWTRVTGVHDAAGKRISVYVDGSLLTTSPTASTWTAAGPFRLGTFKYNTYYWDHFPGELADVKVYATALTPDQIPALTDD